jgi:endonuclease/exonuclease/phosphatase family metal-dependent hydrolase
MKNLKLLIGFLILLSPLSHAETSLPFLSFDELEQANRFDFEERENNEIQSKLNKLFTSVDVQTKQDIPSPNQFPELGRSLNVVTWNIEKSLNVDVIIDALKLSDAGFIAKVESLDKSEKEKIKILSQIKRFKKADVIVLQEMDYGVNRSKYLYAAKELAEALDMNFAYAPNQVEVDPNLMAINMTTQDYDHHKSLYKGMFGQAVLSRYPIIKTESFPLKTQVYNWYDDELNYYNADIVEKTRRVGAKIVFDVDILRELKRGGRNFFRVDLKVPYVPEGKVSIINIHLEIKASPEQRADQMKEILHYIKGINNPVVVAGDFNSTNRTAESTSIYKFIKGVMFDTSTWLSVATSALIPGSGFILNLARNGIDFIRNLLNPLVRNIPLLSENPSYDLFQYIAEFKFDDGGVFDLRGSKWRSTGQTSKLSNANEKAPIGWHSTFKTPRTLLVFGIERLDWIFVKGYSKSNKFITPKSTEPYRMAPHFGEVFDNFNEAMPERYSDHHPMFVTLPFEEPLELNKREKKEYTEEMAKRKRERFNQGSDYKRGRNDSEYTKS